MSNEVYNDAVIISEGCKLLKSLDNSSFKTTIEDDAERFEDPGTVSGVYALETKLKQMNESSQIFNKIKEKRKPEEIKEASLLFSLLNDQDYLKKMAEKSGTSNPEICIFSKDEKVKRDDRPAISEEVNLVIKHKINLQYEAKLLAKVHGFVKAKTLIDNYGESNKETATKYAYKFWVSEYEIYNIAEIKQGDNNAANKSSDFVIIAIRNIDTPEKLVDSYPNFPKTLDENSHLRRGRLSEISNRISAYLSPKKQVSPYDLGIPSNRPVSQIGK
jgi:hypothetical protein